MKPNWILALSTVMLSATIAASAQKLSAGAPAPCCGITAMNANSGVVTARVTATGVTFQFTVASPQVLATLRIGQGVYANFTAKQVSLDGRSACCQIVSSSPVAAPALPAPAMVKPITPAAPQPTPVAKTPAPAQSAPAVSTATALPPAKTIAPSTALATPSATATPSAIAPATTVATTPATTLAPGSAPKSTAISAAPVVATSPIAAGKFLNPCVSQSSTASSKVPPLKTTTGLQTTAASAAPATSNTFGDTICAGNPYKRTIPIPVSSLRYSQRQVTAGVNGQTVQGAILHLRGLDGIQQAEAQGLIPKSVGDILSMHVRALPVGESDHYLVSPALALAWSNTHPEPALATGKTTDNHEGCNSFSWHCAGEVAEHAEGQADQLIAQAQQEWQQMVGQAAQMYGESAACFTDSSKTLAKVPLQFSEPFQVNLPFSQSGKSGSFSGTISGNVGLGFPVQTNMMTDVSVFYVECLPFMIRPRGVDASGGVTTGTTFTAAITATGKFEQDFPIYSTTPPIPIEVLPIIVAGVPLAEVDMSAYIAADVDVNAADTATASYEVDHTRTVALQFSCAGTGCTGSTTQGPTQTTTAKNAKITGQVTVTPAVYAALQFDFDFDALSVRAGPKPALIAQVNGCAYAGQTTTTITGAASNSVASTLGGDTQHSQCLVADVDWKTDFVDQILIGGQSVGSQTNALVGARHIAFYDLMPGGSTALIAGVTQAANAAAGQPTQFQVQMPQCYPYTDKIQYQVSWTGGGSGVPDPAACTWNNTAGTGTCFANPTQQLALGFQWPAGDHSLSVTLVHDAHPRDFNVTPNAVSVNVGSGGVIAPTVAAKPSAP
jgi:hypothetical protein